MKTNQFRNLVLSLVLFSVVNVLGIACDTTHSKSSDHAYSGSENYEPELTQSAEQVDKPGLSGSSSPTVFPAISSEENTNMLHTVYFQSVAYPENFDQTKEELFVSYEAKASFMACLNSLKAQYFQEAVAYLENCRANHAGNPQQEWDCIQNNSSASLYVWLKALTQVLNGEVPSWLQTFAGSSYYAAKQQAELIAPGFWVPTIQQEAMPLVRPMIVCP